MDKPEKYYNLKEVAELLGITERTARSYVATKGIMKGVKLAGTRRWAVPESEIIRMQKG